MLEIPNDQFQLEPIYNPIPVGIWVNRLESLLEHVVVNLKIWKKKKTKNLINKKIKIPKEAKSRYGMYLMEAKFTFKVGMYKHFNMLMLLEWLFRLTKSIDSAKRKKRSPINAEIIHSPQILIFLFLSWHSCCIQSVLLFV